MTKYMKKFWSRLALLRGGSPFQKFPQSVPCAAAKSYTYDPVMLHLKNKFQRPRIPWRCHDRLRHWKEDSILQNPCLTSPRLKSLLHPSGQAVGAAWSICYLPRALYFFVLPTLPAWSLGIRGLVASHFLPCSRVLLSLTSLASLPSGPPSLSSQTLTSLSLTVGLFVCVFAMLPVDDERFLDS